MFNLLLLTLMSYSGRPLFTVWLIMWVH